MVRVRSGTEVTWPEVVSNAREITIFVVILAFRHVEDISEGFRALRLGLESGLKLRLGVRVSVKSWY